MNDVINNLAAWVNDNLVAIGFLLPLVVGIVTKATAPQWLKTLVMIVLTGVAALLAAADQAGGAVSAQLFNEWVTTMVVTIASYYGVWKPIGAGAPLPSIGIGPRS